MVLFFCGLIKIKWDKTGGRSVGWEKCSAHIVVSIFFSSLILLVPIRAAEMLAASVESREMLFTMTGVPLQWSLECDCFPLWGFIIFFTALTEPDTESWPSDCSRNAKLEPKEVPGSWPRFSTKCIGKPQKVWLWEPLPSTIRSMSCFPLRTCPCVKWMWMKAEGWKGYWPLLSSFLFFFCMSLHLIYRSFKCLHSRTLVIIPYSTPYLLVIDLQYI